MYTITEDQIRLIGRRSNNGKKLGELEDLLKKAEEGAVYVTDSQAVKGYKYLMNLYKSPKGKERKNNPFGYREMDALDGGLDTFTYDGHYNAGNRLSAFWVPLYTFIGNNGGTFQYYVSGGEIQIVG